MTGEQWTNRTEQRDYSEKEKGLLEMDYADPCPDCGAVMFEWWDECPDCEGTGALQSTLGGYEDA